MTDEELLTALQQRFLNTAQLNAWLTCTVWPSYHRKKLKGDICTHSCAPDGSLLTETEFNARWRDGLPLRDRSTGKLYRVSHERLGGKVYHIQKNLPDPPRA